MTGTTLFHNGRFSCEECGVFITESSSYQNGEKKRCWPCHCRSLSVWDEEHQRPMTTMNKDGFPVDEDATELH